MIPGYTRDQIVWTGVLILCALNALSGDPYVWFKFATLFFVGYVLTND